MAKKSVVKEASSQERDVRLGIINSLLSTPHREVKDIISLHKEFMLADPTFYGRLAAWYYLNGDIRDHKEVFIATMFLSKLEEHRSAAFAMLVDLPPFQIPRVLRHLKIHFNSVPTAFRTAVKMYLRTREMNEKWFDATVVRSKTAMRTMYASLHVKPTPRANDILFKNEPPEGSAPYFVKVLSDKDMSDVDRARMIVEKRIPFTIAVGAVPAITAPILVALIESMSPQEVVNCIGQLKRRGAMDDEEMRKMVHAKIDKVSKDKRASGTKAAVAADVVGVDAETRKKLEKATNETVKAKGRIKCPTAILVDRSGSLHVAIAVGTHIAGILSGVCESDLYVYAFNDMAMEIKSEGKEATDWIKAFRGLTASGSTSVGSGFAALERAKRYVEQVVIVTDEQENASPYSGEAYQKYCKATGASPNVTIVRVGEYKDYCQKRLREVGASVDTLVFEGDYYGFGNLVSMLSRPSRLALLMEIAETPLPTREDAEDCLFKSLKKIERASTVDAILKAEPESEEGEATCSTSDTTVPLTTSKSKSKKGPRTPK